MKIHFGHCVAVRRCTTPSTELPRAFCAGIGPLQLGVVLVFYFFNYFNCIFFLASLIDVIVVDCSRIIDDLFTKMSSC